MAAMHFRLLALASLAAVSAVVAPPLATAVASPPATVKVVVRPVTSTGHPAHGFTVRSEPNGLVDCSSRSPSPGAVDRDIEACSPSAEYAVACWKASAPHRALCVRNPANHTVFRIPREGSFKATGLLSASQRAPLRIVLGDGAQCSIRDGGAGGILAGHPTYVATYYCTRDGAVWAPAGANHFGINEAAASWTVRTAQAGHHSLTVRHVAKAYFVGTKH